MNATVIQNHITVDAPPDFRDVPPLEAVYRLADSCGFEAGHAHQVTRLALALFEGLRNLHLHSLNGKHRHWLTCAALLHDIGWAHGPRGHHKSSLKFILESPLLPWDLRQRLVVGSIARYHRKAMPKQSHDHFVQLKRRDQDTVTILSSLLRVGDALDRTHRGVVRELGVDVNGLGILISCRTDRPAEIERIKALQKADLMEKVFNRKVEIRWRLR